MATVIAVAGGLSIAQFFTTERVNSIASGDIAAPPEIESTLRRACYDCHSNETRWPWYSGVAPVSWIFGSEVERGRKQINFSEWGSYYPATRRRKLQWTSRAIRAEAMPPWSYRLMHPDSRLTERDRAMLEQWIESQTDDATPKAESNSQVSK